MTKHYLSVAFIRLASLGVMSALGLASGACNGDVEDVESKVEDKTSNNQVSPTTESSTSTCVAAADPNESSCTTPNTYNSHGCATCSTVGSCKSGEFTILNGSHYCDVNTWQLLLCKDGVFETKANCGSCSVSSSLSGDHTIRCWAEDASTSSSKSTQRLSGAGCYDGIQRASFCF
jgi:hypothetical protein